MHMFIANSMYLMIFRNFPSTFSTPISKSRKKKNVYRNYDWHEFESVGPIMFKSPLVTNVGFIAYLTIGGNS